MNNDRRGKFKVACRLLRDWEKMLPLFSQIVVIRTDYDFANDAIEFTAYSRLFEPLDEAVASPTYEIVFDATDLDHPKFTARRL